MSPRPQSETDLDRLEGDPLPETQSAFQGAFSVRGDRTGITAFIRGSSSGATRTALGRSLASLGAVVPAAALGCLGIMLAADTIPYIVFATVFAVWILICWMILPRKGGVYRQDGPIQRRVTDLTAVEGAPEVGGIIEQYTTNGEVITRFGLSKVELSGFASSRGGPNAVTSKVCAALVTACPPLVLGLLGHALEIPGWIDFGLVTGSMVLNMFVVLRRE